MRARSTCGTSSTKCRASARPNDSGSRTASPASLANAFTVFFVASVVRHLVLSPRRWTSAKSPRSCTLTL
jgi:hypothetical protein